MPQINTIYYLIFLLNFVGCLFIYVNAHEDVLKTTIIDENNEDIELTWVKSERSFLANHNLPIRTISHNKLSKPRKVFHNTHEFIAYHDLDKFSAVIYIKKKKCITGVVDTRYYIECLPILLLDKKHHVTKENEFGYIFRYNFANPFGNKISTLYSEPSESNDISSYDPDSINVDYDETFLESQLDSEIPELTDADLEEILPTYPNSESSNNPVSPNLNHPLPSDPDFINVDYDETLLHSQSNSELPKLTDADLEELLPTFPNSEPSLSQGAGSSINFASPDINPVSTHDSEPFFMDQEITYPHVQSNLDFSILTNTIGERTSPSTSCMYSPLNKKRRLKKRSNEKKLDTLYPEILVFVSYDITKIAQVLYGNKCLSWLVYHFIAYFNAVDMLFAQLAKEDINIHINIATIVIETAPHAFNINLNVRKSSGKSKLDSIVQTIKKHKSVFTTDTFDFFHFATTEKWTEDVENRQGLSTEWFSAYSQRIQKPSLKYWKYAGSIVRHEKNVQDYIVAAREIAYLMEIKYEVKTRICHGVIQGYNPSSCLKWSRKTIKGFKRYISESRNRCFLLNYPRSLHPHNIPVELISPTKQCSCYNQEFHYSKDIELVSVIPNNCHEQLKCFIPNDEGVLKQIQPLPEPLYGTPCGENKVCFAHKCLPITLETIVID